MDGRAFHHVREVLSAVRAEMGGDHPRIRRVAEGVYWFADAEIPLG